MENHMRTDTEILQEVQKNFVQVQEDALLNMPMWMRLNWALNTIGQIYNRHPERVPDIDWDKVNRLLTENVDEYDFNLIDAPIHSLDELWHVREPCIQATVLGGPWQQHTCKDCGRTFLMSYSEVTFFERNQLCVPKRCPECRAARKERKNAYAMDCHY